MKLSSRNVLQEACCQNYSAASLRPHLLLLWPSLRREVVEGSNAELEAAATSSLAALVRALEAGLDEGSPLSASSKQSIKDGLTQLGVTVMSGKFWTFVNPLWSHSLPPKRFFGPLYREFSLGRAFSSLKRGATACS